MLEDYQKAFIEFAIDAGVLRFGEFELKSGRISPYFFNAGELSHGVLMSRVGKYYAAALKHAGISFDMLFGPAYKGIPLVVATAIAYADDHGTDVPFAFNRKEAKHHGEGGMLVGAELKGKVIIVDDVITAGTAIREVLDLLAETPASVAGALVAIDRQERGHHDKSAIQEIEAEFGIPVVSVVNLGHIVSYLEQTGRFQQELVQMQAYRDKYGVTP